MSNQATIRAIPRVEESSEEEINIDTEQLEDCLPSIRQFFEALNGDENYLFDVLASFSLEISMSDEQVLLSQPLELVLRKLLELLNLENPEILIQIMTTINTILDLLPHLTEVIISYSGIENICIKLKIGNPEISKQSVYALEHITKRFPLEVLQSKVIEPLISIIDFFDTEVQRKILNIMCLCIDSLESLEVVNTQIFPLMPTILAFLKNHENEVKTEKTLNFFGIFIEKLLKIIPIKGDEFKRYSEKLIKLDAVQILIELFNTHREPVLKLLSKMCGHSALMVMKFLMADGVALIGSELTRIESAEKSNPAAILNLLNALVPKMPAIEIWNKEKIDFYGSHLEYISDISGILFPKAKSISEHFLTKEDKLLMISILEKLLRLTKSSNTHPLIFCQAFATFISEQLISKDLPTIKSVLKISLILYEKFPHKVDGVFIREGVIQRISVLKEPGKLKTLKKFSGNNTKIFKANLLKSPYQMEFVLNNVKKKMLKPVSLEENRREIIGLCKKIIEKHRINENKKATKIGKELKSVALRLAKGFGDSAQEVLKKLITLIKSEEKISYFELSNSGLADSLWKWLADVNISRFREFLTLFLMDSSKDELLLTALARLLIGTANFVQHFRIILHDNTTLSSRRKQKSKVVLEYHSQGTETSLSTDPEFISRHNLFKSHRTLNLTLSQFFSFDRLKHLLLRISNQSDMKLLSQQALINESTLQLFLNKPFASNLVVSISNNGKEIPRGATVLNIVSKKCGVVLKFKFIRRTDVDLKFNYSRHTPEILNEIIRESSRIGIEEKEKSYPYFRLSKLLYLLSENLPNLQYIFGLPPHNSLQPSVFSNNKLSAILSRQLQDKVAIEGNIPISWIRSFPVKSSFFFSLSARNDYMHALGPIISEKPKFKSIVGRDTLLNDAMVILNDSGVCTETSLEVSYNGENGTGLGPTIEFFALVSDEIKNLKIWREMCDECGLFPCPVGQGDENWEKLFDFIGRFIGKAIVDRRHLDFQLSPALWKLVFSQPLNLFDLLHVDKSIGKHLLNFVSDPKDIEKAQLLFTLPGYPKIELIPNGNKTLVTSENIEDYAYLTATHTLDQLPQAAALKKGLETMLSSDVLSLFTYSEIEDILCGENESNWTIEVLQIHITPTHGYSSTSRTFENMLLLLSRLNTQQRKNFLEFVTGFPRLPLGGFEKLTPKLSIVKKDSEGNEDTCLPSVMTCQNYLKIPDYSSYEALERNILYAIKEGRHAFYLS